jgi:predicted nucleotidyltransferase
MEHYRMPITQEVIEEVKKRLIDVYNPLKIYLFGSYAWGSPTEDSDLDLLIVIEESNEKRHKRGKPGYMALWGMDISKDLMIYTKDELEQRATDPSSLIYKILKEGRVLHARLCEVENRR